MVKDASNNWALNSATGGLDSFKAYQSTNSGDTYIDASNSTGHIRLNYESGSGAETDIYSGSSANLDAAFLGPTSIKFPGLAASSGHFCLQVDTSGYLTNTGSACGSGSGSTSGTINSGSYGADCVLHRQWHDDGRNECSSGERGRNRSVRRRPRHWRIWEAFPRAAGP